MGFVIDLNKVDVVKEVLPVRVQRCYYTDGFRAMVMTLVNKHKLSHKQTALYLNRDNYVRADGKPFTDQTVASLVAEARLKIRRGTFNVQK